MLILYDRPLPCVEKKYLFKKQTKKAESMHTHQKTFFVHFFFDCSNKIPSVEKQKQTNKQTLTTLSFCALYWNILLSLFTAKEKQQQKKPNRTTFFDFRTFILLIFFVIFLAFECFLPPLSKINKQTHKKGILRTNASKTTFVTCRSCVRHSGAARVPPSRALVVRCCFVLHRRPSYSA